MNDWTDDIKKLMDGYEVKAPDGLLEDVKNSLPKDFKAVPKVREPHSGNKARLLPIRRYRWIAAAAVAAIVAVPVFKGLLTEKERKQVGPSVIAGSGTVRSSSPSAPSLPASVSSVSELNVGGETVEPTLVAKLDGQVNEKSASQEDVELASQEEEVAEAEAVASPSPQTAEAAETHHNKFMSKQRGSGSRHQQDGYALAYVPHAESASSWTVGAYCGGASGGNGSLGPSVPVLASSVSEGITPAGKAVAEDFINLAAAVPKRKASHKQPIKAGVSVGYRINGRWSVQTGLTYSYLSSDFTSDQAPKETQRLHYVGVPLTGSYDIAKGRKAEVYVTAGGEVEKLVKGMVAGGNGESRDVKESRPQWSVKAAVGGAYRFTPSVSVYVEPGVSRHFDNHSGVENVYKERSTSFSLNMGIRVDINGK